MIFSILFLSLIMEKLMIKFRTSPVETYEIDGTPILVKREDKATPKPGPPFSKTRGIVPALLKIKESGINIVGYTETSISMAGWGLAWACSELDMKCVLFDPQYKLTPTLLKFHRKKWKRFNVEIIPIKAGMARVNYNISRNLLRQKYGEKAVMIDLGMPFYETVIETAKEAKKTFNKYAPKTVVINVGSGTICAGVVREARGIDVYGIMGRTGNIPKKEKQIQKKAGPGKCFFNGILKNRNLHLVDPGWEYTQPSKASAPFPCHPFYDKKAWEWLKYAIHGGEEFKQPLMFWNIGR